MKIYTVSNTIYTDGRLDDSIQWVICFNDLDKCKAEIEKAIREDNDALNEDVADEDKTDPYIFWLSPMDCVDQNDTDGDYTAYHITETTLKE